MKITKLPKDPGPAAWNAILPTQDAAQVLDQNITADWLIIGAGFAGLTAAARLRQLAPKDRIVVLDATQIADGPAGRNSGFMVDLPHDLASSDYGGEASKDLRRIAQNRHGINFAAELVAEFGIDQHAFNPCGKINAAATDKGHRHNLEYAEHLAGINEASDILDAQQMHELTGSRFFQSGLFTAGTVILQPALYIRSLAEGLRKQGVEIYEKSPVIELRQDENWKATTPQGQVEAPKAILSVNGHANSFGKFKGRLLHIFTYGSMTRNLTAEEQAKLGGQPEWGVTPADPLGSTVRRITGIGGDRIIVRNTFTYDPSMEVTDAKLKRIGTRHRKSFDARFPMLKDVDMEYVWGGRLCLSWNDVAAMGEVEKNLYSACCQNGLGTVQGTFNGMMMAELAAGAPSEMCKSVLNDDQPCRLPPAPLTFIGARARLMRDEARAGKEL